MTAAALSLLAAAIWLYLLLGRGGFWLTRERDTNIFASTPGNGNPWPSVTAIVPARNEADVIATTLSSLLAQDYPGPFHIVLVDDQSDDGTGAIARALDNPDRLIVLSGAARPPGWTGKLWAVSQGVAHASHDHAPTYLWLTDADIAHTPDNLRQLVARAESGGLVLTSLMAKLHCRDLFERFLIPAFVFFFAMLYPFGLVNRQRSTVAAAAGGCMLVKRTALENAGGIGAIAHEIIDDCALGRLMKGQGPIWLGLTNRARSVRPYDGIGEIHRMVARSAYAQLHYSPLLLVGTVLGMVLLYLVPPSFALLGAGLARIGGIAAWVLMAVAFQPMLRFYRVTPLWGLALPMIGLFYTTFTMDSAIQHWRGRGGMWKGRAQAMGRPS